jgi:hypothetical protein
MCFLCRKLIKRIATYNECAYVLVESNSFVKHLHFLFDPTMPHSTCTLKLTCILLYVHIATWSILGYLGYMGEVLTLIPLNIKEPQDVHIMIRARITNVYVDEQPMMVRNDHVVHFIYLFSTR